MKKIVVGETAKGRSLANLKEVDDAEVGTTIAIASIQ
jgi:hypothetical protein